MSHPLIRKLEQHGPLTDEEKNALRQITMRLVSYEPGETIVPQGSVRSDSQLVVEGFAARHKYLPDGRRQITAFHVPGDFADLHSFLLKKIDDGVNAITRCRIASVQHKDLQQITESFPYLTRLLWLTTLIDGAVHREWITALGRMSARERLSHFLCELYDRLRHVGLAEDHGYELPITQEALGDAFGLSTVHVNRILQELRGEGLITSRGRSLVINDWEGLKRQAQYDGEYLHAERKVERD